MLFPAIPGSRSWGADGIAPCPSRRTVCGGDHWEAPDALWPANGQNQEGARELRDTAVKRPHTRAAYAWAHIGSPGTAMEAVRSLGSSCVYRPAPRPREGSQPYFGAHDGFWVTTLRTSSASVIASTLLPVHPAAVATDCRENVEAAGMLAQLLSHPRLTVGGLPQRPVGQGVAAPRGALSFGFKAKRECASVAGAATEVCSAQRAGTNSAWGSCLMTVRRRRARARAATDGTAAAAERLA